MIFERHTYFLRRSSIPLIYLILLISAIGRTSAGGPQLILSALGSAGRFRERVTWNSSVFQIGSVVGPALGGLLIVRAGFPFIYAVDAACALAFFLLVLPIRSSDHGTSSERNAWRSLMEGIRFIRSKKVVLATITLDMFAVFLGGATALLPIFADQILHCGPIGLGWMRAAPGIGAFIMALLIAYLPPMRHAGKTLLWCVTGSARPRSSSDYSARLVVAHHAFPDGVFDSVSVVVRHSLLQLVTPDSMRGRISAVNNIFIGTSNELGALESGLTAALFGPVISVVSGGVGTILVVLGVMWKWPETRKIGALDKNLR